MRTEKNSVKTLIKKAFFDLLSEKDYAEITVSDLVNKAQIARMSFYRNFNNIDDVIDSIADDRMQDFENSVLPVIEENSERKWREYLFAMFYRFIELQKEIGIPFTEFEKKRTSSNVIMLRVQEKISQAERNLPAETLAEKYIPIGKIDLIHGIARKWATSGMQETPEEVIELIMSIITKF